MRVLNDQYAVMQTLGSGLQGKVKLGVDLKTNEHVALKLIKSSKLTQKAILNLYREIQAMKLVQHPNVMRLLAVAKDVEYPKKKGGSEKVVLVVLELATGGELFDFMMFTGHFSEEIARTYFRQLVSGLHACHVQGVYHRDIKPENLLLDKDFQLRIADFGLSAISEDLSVADDLTTQCGTRAYMSPEIIAGTPYEGSPADVWSAGVVLFILLAGFPPFQIATRQDWWFRACAMQQYQAFWAAHSRTAVFSPMAMDLLTRIFDVNPATRITLQEIWQHPWMHEPVLSDAAMTKELMARKEKVTQEKVRAQKAKEAKAAASAQTTFNPFDRNTHRSISMPPSASSLHSADMFLPTIQSCGIPAYTTLRCFASSAADLLQRLHASFDTAGLKYVWTDSLATPSENVKAKAQISTSSGRVDVMLRLHPVEYADGLFLVEVRRRGGDLFAFRHVFDLVSADLQDILADDAAPPAKVALPPAAAGDDDEVEELISDEALMI
ncbi:CAMK protein kinase [Aphanomyces invadans]|uniref:non-specific serine/threonine protein kinase n=1 Tax=Aphanomyces invadans TaxID=157072 RepID=A0A024U6L8_9STRA|nr:CAMK protein kinase [Aphanomyces invadans]ETW01532.1 CAMK protein kinase [Aphanomyces invadans]|eukprot:XP_008869380.1 CAMK protein kinase [Aphanomyces invadans]